MTRKKEAAPRRETDLYAPIHDYLVAQGYTVRAEVNHCDITARKGDELIVIELKRRFNVELLIQATARRRITGSVYVAFPALNDFGPKSRWPGIKRILRQLELGLILVFFSGGAPRVEVVFHPIPYRPRQRKQARRAVIREMDSRSGNYNQGGAAQTKLITAYRENAIQIACCLDELGPLAPRQLRELGTGPKTTAILCSNVYGWFDRIARGVYALTAKGREELNAYPALARHYRQQFEEKPR